MKYVVDQMSREQTQLRDKKLFEYLFLIDE
jgi:hypothetical protein